MSDTVQQIKDRLSIQDVVSQYVKLDRAGSTLRARCPFHAEKTPSFFVSPDRGTYHCFGCNQGGDIFTFVQQIEGLDFKGALKVLAEKAGVPLVYERQEHKDERDRLFEMMEAATIFYISKLSDDAKKYLKNRGVNDATINEFRVGYAGSEWSELSDFLKRKKYTDKEIVDAGLAKKNERGNLTDKFRNRIMFPIADSAGRIVAFSGRIFGENASPEAPKYLNSPETILFHKSRILYGFDRAKVAMRKVSCAVLVEGQMDLLMSHQAGWANAVAVSGTAFTEDHAKLIRRMTDNLVLALDADAAGIKAAGRAARAALASGLNVKVAQLPDGLDPADLILKDPEEWRTAIREAKDIITFLLDVLEKHASMPDRFRRSVETVVLPFLSDVQSPIARAQYVRGIARRLEVPEHAIEEALHKVPTSPATPVQLKPEGTLAKTSDRANPSSAQGFGRAQHAFGILLWQEALPKGQFDTAEYRAALSEAIGEEGMAKLESISQEEREIMRFTVERLLGNNQNVARDAKELLRGLHEERLRKELAEATLGLAEAERGKNEEELADLNKKVKLLTGKIAQLNKRV
ncbi:DNA primase [Candidatus Parcubacteria bacterium]|nr:MAG: DNA primase [Candidatus Parcubacteria bacterium]